MPNPYQQHLLNLADRSKTLERLIAANLQAGDCARLHGLSGSAKALAIARLQQRTGRSVLVVCPNAEAAEAWYDDMEHFGIPGALHFPMSETLPYEVEEPVIEIVSRQFSTLYYLARGERPDTTKAPKADDPGSQEPSAPPLIIAPIEALHRRIPSRADFRGLFLSFWWGERFDLDATVRQLIEMGYERESITEARGEFSVRGHIVDIYPPPF